MSFEPATTATTVYGVYLYTKPAGGSRSKVRLLAQSLATNTTGLFGVPFSLGIHLDVGTAVKITFAASQNCTIKSDYNVTYLNIYRRPAARA